MNAANALEWPKRRGEWRRRGGQLLATAAAAVDSINDNGRAGSGVGIFKNAE